MPNLPRFEGRQIKKEDPTLQKKDPIDISPKYQDSLPKIEEPKKENNNFSGDLFGKIKELFQINKLPSKTTINNVTYNTKNIKNGSSPTNTSNSKSLVDNSNRITEQNKKISIMNTFMGKNPTVVKNDKLFNFPSPKIEKNINTIQNKIDSAENLWKNEYNTPNSVVTNKSDIKNTIVEPSANLSIKYNSTLNNDQSNKEKQTVIQNNTNTNPVNNTEIKSTSSSAFHKTSIERKPHFYESKKVKYVFSPKHEKSFVSFAEGGSMMAAGPNSVVVNQPTPIAMAGDAKNGSAEIVSSTKNGGVEVSPVSGPNSIDAAAKATRQSQTEKITENKNQEAREQMTGGEVQMEGGNGGGAVVNNISTNITNKQMTTFEKVAIETAFLPNWRRIFG